MIVVIIHHPNNQGSLLDDFSSSFLAYLIASLLEFYSLSTLLIYTLAALLSIFTCLAMNDREFSVVSIF